MFVPLCFRNVECWHVPVLGPLRYRRAQKIKRLAPEVVPGASLHFETLTPECGRECLETGDCGPARRVGARRWGLLGLTAQRCSGPLRYRRAQKK